MRGRSDRFNRPITGSGEREDIEPSSRRARSVWPGCPYRAAFLIARPGQGACRRVLALTALRGQPCPQFGLEMSSKVSMDHCSSRISLGTSDRGALAATRRFGGDVEGFVDDEPESGLFNQGFETLRGLHRDESGLESSFVGDAKFSPASTRAKVSQCVLS